MPDTGVDNGAGVVYIRWCRSWRRGGQDGRTRSDAGIDRKSAGNKPSRSANEFCRLSRLQVHELPTPAAETDLSAGVCDVCSRDKSGEIYFRRRGRNSRLAFG